ncbi:MAG: tRNA (adenosine(37)-N6)-threonylcarbamoyltransferase complex dimerization subunit type 1 TsaB [Syntrophobacteraceae bacterium]
MKILAVDTSTSSGSVALLDEMRVMAEWTLHSAQTHNRRLLKTVELLLKEVGWAASEVDAFAATVGPGSFTGVRIGLTTMKTLAWALNKPLIGIASLDALAFPLGFSSYPVCPLIDARKKEVYCAVFSREADGSLRKVEPYQVIPPERLPGFIKEPTLFCGDGWLLYRDQLQRELGVLALGAPSPFHLIRASFVGELARLKLLTGESENPINTVPLYIRPSEAELKAS